MIVDTVLEQCAERWRTPVAAPKPQARRLFHGRGHSYPGCEAVVVNEFPPYLQVALFEEVPAATLDALCKGLLALRPEVAGICVQRREGRKTSTSVEYGEVPDEHLVYEGELAFWITPKRNQNVGLFLDMAHVRQYLAAHMPEANVLNLFAYTCAFSVAAIAQGARAVVNNDMSRNALQIGERNHTANNQDLRQVRMLPHNLFKSWWKIRQCGPFDVVIIDPPTNQRGSFVAEKSYGQILKRIPEFTRPGGRVITCLNSPFLGPEFLTQQMQRWCPQSELREILPAHSDFPDKYPERALKVMDFVYTG
ncbi:MAG: class I SAM-dependent methyltransferase [Pseudomonadota bacterium]